MKESNGIDKSNRNRKKKNNKIEKLLHTLCTKLDCVSIHEPIKIDCFHCLDLWAVCKN